MADVANETKALVRCSGVTFGAIDRRFEFDMLYLGQTPTVVVPIMLVHDDELERDAIHAAFETAYRQAFGRLLTEIPIRLMKFRMAVISRRPAFDMSQFSGEALGTVALITRSSPQGSFRFPVHAILTFEPCSFS